MGVYKMDDKYISINPTMHLGHYVLRLVSNNSFFQEEKIVINVFTDYISIKLPYIDDVKNIYATSKYGNGPSRKVSVRDRYMNIPNGRYVIDEEDSTEDELIIYLTN